MTSSPTKLFQISALTLLAAACVTITDAPKDVDTSAGAMIAQLAPQALRMDGYAAYEREISSANPVAQDWFDRGIQLVYGFNHDAAVNCFAAAARAEPECPMAWWGIAYAYGVDVNNPQVEEHEARYAQLAAQKAMSLMDNASPMEQALIRAIAERAVFPLPEDRKPLDEAYARAMEEAWARFPGDADVGALYAEAMMNLQPWNYWTAEGAPIERADEIVSVLEGAMANDPDHPGANHFYIHAVESSGSVERAVASAELLENLMPGSGHLVHMPSHIYINVGRYQDAVTSNQVAIERDAEYFAQMGAPTFYHLYYIHNFHFLAYAAMMSGQSQVALDATLRMEQEVPEEFLQNFTGFADGMMTAKLHVLIRFGRWQAILDEPDYPEYRKVSNAIREYARTIALANLGRTEEARSTLQHFRDAIAGVPEEWSIGVNPAHDVLALALQMAEAELLWNEGDSAGAFTLLRAAVLAEDALVYDEPPGWMLPVRHALGALLLANGNATEALEVYEADLLDNHGNAWSTLGIEKTYRALGRDAEADAWAPKVSEAWSRADVTPSASCYCAAP